MSDGLSHGKFKNDSVINSLYSMSTDKLKEYKKGKNDFNEVFKFHNSSFVKDIISDILKSRK